MIQIRKLSETHQPPDDQVLLSYQTNIVYVYLYKYLHETLRILVYIRI